MGYVTSSRDLISPSVCILGKGLDVMQDNDVRQFLLKRSILVFFEMVSNEKEKRENVSVDQQAMGLGTHDLQRQD